MKIVIQPTDIMTEICGQKARLWDGVTDDGIQCQVFVAAVASSSAADCSAFEKHLQEIPPPTEALPLWMISPGSPS